MNKQLLLIIAFLTSATFSHAMQPGDVREKVITLPSSEVISQRLDEIGLRYFVEKSKIDKRLGNQQKYPLGVALAVELAIYDHAQYLKQPMMGALMQMQKPEIIKAILKDHPEAITSLEKEGLLEKAKM